MTEIDLEAAQQVLKAQPFNELTPDLCRDVVEDFDDGVDVSFGEECVGPGGAWSV